MQKQLLFFGLYVVILVQLKAKFLDKRRGLNAIIDKDGLTCDMNKKVLRAITIEEGPHVIYNNSCIDRLPESNSSYIEITDCIYGWMVDFFLVLEKHCNFILKVFQSKMDMPYGDVVKMQEGGYNLSGMFAEVDNFDMILGATLITLERAEVVNYLYPLVDTRMVIFINNDLDHQNQWLMYCEIFTMEVWLTILAIATLPTIISALHDVLVFEEPSLSFKGMTRKFVASFAYYFGGNFLDRRHRGLILICHLSYGIIIWIFFRGSLTSKLTERAYKYPFTSLEEFSRTNYRLLTARKDTKVANHFLNAIENSSREMVWLNNMDQNSFTGLKTAAEKIFEESMTAMYYYELEGSYHLAIHDKFCDSFIPWKNDKKLLYSVSVNKNFSNFESMNMLAKRMRQSGMVQKFLVQHYHDIVPDTCKEEKQVEVGNEKVFPLFLILIGAMIISILYMLIIELKY